ETAVSELEDERLVNDARYVEAAVAGRIARGQGPVRIMLELRRHGVAAALVESAVEPRSPAWAERAAELRRRRFGSGAPAGPAERARQVRFLLQRGFTGAQVRHALGARAVEDLDLDDPSVQDEPGDDEPSAD
ncbi:MAG: RecX family transcriptional regulator, partial [Proteobacteria bacterium]|nr:RecX family transcriptional regulator [Pseudomonadota bacterium]